MHYAFIHSFITHTHTLITHYCHTHISTLHTFPFNHTHTHTCIRSHTHSHTFTTHIHYYCHTHITTLHTFPFNHTHTHTHTCMHHSHSHAHITHSLTLTPTPTRTPTPTPTPTLTLTIFNKFIESCAHTIEINAITSTQHIQQWLSYLYLLKFLSSIISYCPILVMVWYLFFTWFNVQRSSGCLVEKIWCTSFHLIRRCPVGRLQFSTINLRSSS